MYCIIVLTIDLIFEPTGYMDHFGLKRMWSIHQEYTLLVKLLGKIIIKYWPHRY